MTRTFTAREWDSAFSPDERTQAVCALERGEILFFSELPFRLQSDEKAFLTPDLVRNSKNISFDPGTNTIAGAVCTPEQKAHLECAMQRFAMNTATLLKNLLPYSELQQGRTSFRPVQVETRVSSWRKDDTRLHVDAFPSSPTQGKRILRVFSNVNPEGRARTWRVGESFSTVVETFLPRIRRPLPASGHLMHLLRITKRRRTEYDHIMLQLHDTMKADSQYQNRVGQTTLNFPSGSTWICFTDQVSHAAIAGQFQFEQTFHLGVNQMMQRYTAPLVILERATMRSLV